MDLCSEKNKNLNWSNVPIKPRLILTRSAFPIYSISRPTTSPLYRSHHPYEPIYILELNLSLTTIQAKNAFNEFGFQLKSTKHGHKSDFVAWDVNVILFWFHEPAYSP
uniref:Uncharacterized protein n=1 Tax=Lactuca sativa TaxID=4236 RepID=A0A9R1XPY9_LACSA|nr:hypothetical protein LSAT_V11C300119040 [Lactuca sativa]